MDDIQITQTALQEELRQLAEIALPGRLPLGAAQNLARARACAEDYAAGV
jgi:hypothetical protein